jgi:hypothetical protein
MSLSKEKTKRKIWQFSLRGLLLLMLPIATFFSGWKASDWYRDREHAEAQKRWVLELLNYRYVDHSPAFVGQSGERRLDRLRAESPDHGKH